MPTSADGRPRPGGGWVFLFLVGGMIAIGATIWFAGSPADGLPWVLLAWPPVILAGYRIWRNTNPTGSAVAQVRHRLAATVTVIAMSALAFVVIDLPQLAFGVGLTWLALLVLLGLMLTVLERRT
jgi:hypothetical protein